MAADEPPTEYSWNIPEGAWPAWYSAHRDARAEILCSARLDNTQLVEIHLNRESFVPALRELARLRLIEFFELERWDLPQDQLHRISNERASALLDIAARWNPESDEPRVFFWITDKGVQAAEAEAFHFNDGRFVEWHDDGS